MIENLGNEVKFSQEKFEESISEAEKKKESYIKISKRRKAFAYSLKAISLFGGIVVAVFPITASVVGVLIVIAVALDYISSNYKSLVIYTEAANAIGRTLTKVKNDYNYELLPIIRINSENNPENTNKVRELVSNLARESMKFVNDELDKIQTAIDLKQVEFLTALNLDDKGPNTESRNSLAPPPK